MRIFSFIFTFFLFSLSSARATDIKTLWGDSTSSAVTGDTVVGAVKSLGNAHGGSAFERAIIGWDGGQVHKGFSLYSQCLEIGKFIGDAPMSPQGRELINSLHSKLTGTIGTSPLLDLGMDDGTTGDRIDSSSQTVFGLLKQIQNGLKPNSFPQLSGSGSLQDDLQARIGSSTSTGEGSLYAQLGSKLNPSSSKPEPDLLTALKNDLEALPRNDVSLYPILFYGEASLQTALCCEENDQFSNAPEKGFKPAIKQVALDHKDLFPEATIAILKELWSDTVVGAVKSLGNAHGGSAFERAIIGWDGGQVHKGFSLYSQCLEIGKFIENLPTSSAEGSNKASNIIDLVTNGNTGLLITLNNLPDELTDEGLGLGGNDRGGDDGIDKTDPPTTIFGLLKKIQEILLPQNLKGQELPFLRFDSVYESGSSNPTPQSVDSLLVALRTDAKDRLSEREGSLLKQLTSITALQRVNSPIESAPTNEENSCFPSLSAHLDRLSKCLNSASFREITLLYPRFFYGESSFQTTLIKITDSSSDLHAEVGTPFSGDDSLFGLIKQTFDKFLTPIKDAFSGAFKTLQKFPVQNTSLDSDDRKLLAQKLGSAQSEELYCSQLLAALSYIEEECWPNLTVFASYETIQEISNLILGPPPSSEKGSPDSSSLTSLAEKLENENLDLSSILSIVGNLSVSLTANKENTLYNITISILNKIHEAFFKSLTSLNEDFSYIKKIKDYVQQNLFKMSLTPFAQTLWSSADSPGFQLLSTSSTASNSSDKAAFDEAFYKLLFTKPVSLIQQAAEQLSLAKKQLNSTKDQLSPTQKTLQKALADALQLIGEPLSSIPPNSDDPSLTLLEGFPNEATAFALLKEIELIMSSQKLFFEALNAWPMNEEQPGDLSKFSFFSFLQLLGAPVDSEVIRSKSAGPEEGENSKFQVAAQSGPSLLERSFFETIDHLNSATSADIIALTVGFKETPANSRCRSLFSFLNTALVALSEPFAEIHWASSKSQTSKSSNNIHENIKSKLGSISTKHTELTSLAGEILQKLSNIHSEFKEVREEISPALVYKFVHATRLISQYVVSSSSSDENSSRIFCQELEALVVLELGAFLVCPDCYSLVENLREIVQEFAPLVEVVWSDAVATLFEKKESFIPLTQSVQRFSTTLEDFAQNLAQARTRYEGESCSLSHCTELQSTLMSDLKAIAQELKTLIKSSGLWPKEQQLSFLLNEGCPSLPSALENLSKGINDLARNMSLPSNNSYDYGLSQHKTWKALGQSLGRIRDSVASIVSLTHKCCTSNEAALSDAIASFLESLRSLNEKTSEIAQFIKNATPLLRSISDYWEEIASLLQRRPLFSSLPQETLWTALSSSTALEPWRSLTEALENGGHALPLTLETSHNIKTDATGKEFKTLQEATEGIVCAWNGLFSFLEGLTELNRIPQASSFNTSKLTKSTPTLSLLKALDHIDEALTRDTNFMEVLSETLEKHSEEALEANIPILVFERMSAAYALFIPYLQNEIEACEKGTPPYRLEENNDEIKGTLSSIEKRLTFIQGTSKNIINQLKSLCSRSPERLLTALACQDLRLKAILEAACLLPDSPSEQDTQIPLPFLDKLTWSETFFPLWAEKMPPIIELVQFLVNEQEHITNEETCLHYTVKTGLNRLETLVMEAVQALWDTAKAQGLSLPADTETVSNKSSPSEAFNKTNGTFAALFNENFKLTSCQSAQLSSALDSLQTSYEALAQALQQFVEPLCLYDDSLLASQDEPSLATRLCERTACFKEAINKLEPNLQCAADNRTAIRAISSLVREIAQRVEKQLNNAAPPSPKDLTNQVEALGELNGRTAEILTFFQEATEGSCLRNLLPLLRTSQNLAFKEASSTQDTERQSLEAALTKLRDVLPSLQEQTVLSRQEPGANPEDSNAQEQTFPSAEEQSEAASTAKETDLVTITQEAVAPLLELKKIAIAASLLPCSTEVTTETKSELFARKAALEQAGQAVQTAANYCHLLAQTLKETAPNFGCSKELSNLAAPLEQCAEAERCVAQTLLVKASHLKDALMPFEYEAHAATIETSTRYNGLSQPEWLEQTEERNREIQKKTACLRQRIVGGQVLPCLKEHCVPPVFLANGKAPF